jgi:hypothetical protein
MPIETLLKRDSVRTRRFLHQAFSGKFANGVNDIVGKFATGVVDTGVIDIN